MNVLIAGGGVAGLEAALTLAELAPDETEVTMLTPEDAFEIRALSVRDPFGERPGRRHELAAIAREAGFALRRGALAAVDASARTVTDADGATHDYEALLVCVGARPRPALPHAVTFAGPEGAEGVHGMLQDLEDGAARRIAFVAPPGATWPLPLYELALMTAERADSLGLDDVSITIVTPEEAPLGLFGPEASAAMASLLADRGIAVRTSTFVEPEARVPALSFGPSREALPVDRVIALPELVGPRIEGLPADADGFLPVDHHGRVDGVEHVWAAGDATSFPIKQGGVAAQQADAAAESIAAAAGADVEPRPFRPVLRGMLLTGEGIHWLRAAVAGTGTTAPADAVAEHALWWPPTKVAGHRLAPFLWEREERGALETPSGGVAVERAVGARRPRRPRRRMTLHAPAGEGHLELLQLQ